MRILKAFIFLTLCSGVLAAQSVASFCSSASNCNVTGDWSFAVSPQAPAPTNATDVANKTYVDTHPSGVSQLNLLNSGTLFGSCTPGQTCALNLLGCTVSGTSPNFTLTCSGGGMVYPGVGVPCSTGSGWCTSYSVGTTPSALVQLDGSSKLPAVDGSQLTNLNPSHFSTGTLASGVSVPWAQVTSSPTMVNQFNGRSGSVAPQSGDYTASQVGAEPALGNPSANGYVLSSTTAGARSWVAQGGGGMIYPGAGVACSTGSGWCTAYGAGNTIPANYLATIPYSQLSGAPSLGSLATLASGAIPAGYTIPYSQLTSPPTLPSGAIVGTTDTQTLTNKTVDGVSPATFAFLDPTSSVQTQLNGKAATNASTTGAAWTGTYTPAANKVLGGATPSAVTVTSNYVDSSICSNAGCPQNTSGYAALFNSWSSEPSSPTTYAVGVNSVFGLAEYYDGALFQRFVTQQNTPIPQAPQASGIFAAISAQHQYSTTNANIVFFGDSHYAGILGASLNTPENAVAFVRNKLQGVQNGAGAGFVSACNGNVDVTCAKHPDPPGTNITSSGAWLHEIQLASGGTGTPFGLDASDVYNTSSGSGSLTFTCQYCSEILVFLKNVSGEGSVTCTIDGSATGACASTISVPGLTSPWINTGALSYTGSHTVVVTLASGVIHCGGAYMYIGNKRGVIVTNLALGSSGATQNAYPFVNFATQANAMLTQINPTAIVIGATGSNECVQGTSVSTFATNLHTLYTTLSGIVGSTVPIIFATGPDEINTSGCTTLSQYEEVIRKEALTDGTRVVDVWQQFSPYTKVQTMLNGGTCYSSVPPHLSNPCADEVADMFVKLFPLSTGAQSLGFGVGYGDFGPLATFKQNATTTQYKLAYNNGGLAAIATTSLTGLTPSALVGSCIGNCGTIGKDADFCISGKCPVTFDSGGGTVGDTVTISSSTNGDVTDSGSTSDPSSCLLVVGTVVNPPPSGGGFGIANISNPHLSAACGSGGGSGVSSFAATAPLHASATTGAVTASLQNSLGTNVTAVPDRVYRADTTVNLTSLGTGCASTVTLASPASDTFYHLDIQLAQTIAYSGTGTHGAVTGQLDWTDAKTSATFGSANNVLWKGSNSTSWGAGPAATETAAASVGNTTVYYAYVPPVFVKGGTSLTFCAEVSTASTDTTGGTFVYSITAIQY